MKKVYIDQELRKYIVPYEMRNNSKSEGKVFTPGTRIPLSKEVKTVRLFTAWSAKDGSASNLDIDLGGAFIKEVDDKLIMEPIAYYNQSEDYAVHSGDFTSSKAVTKESPEYTAEFIDIDLVASKEKGFKYVLSAEFIFSGDEEAKDYSEMNVWSGVQLLNSFRTEKKQSINIDDSLFKVKLDGKFQSHVAIAIDLETNEIVIMDQYSEERSGINVDTMARKMNEYKKLIFNANEFAENMYSFLEMYCEANELEITEEIQDADIICSNNDYNALKENQTMFNISNNLEKIIGLLNK